VEYPFYSYFDNKNNPQEKDSAAAAAG